MVEDDQEVEEVSYDISFRVKVEGVDCYVPVGEQNANITWNVKQIIQNSTGLEWKNEENNGLCVDVMPKIKAGLADLRLLPQFYRIYESPNGCGTVKGTIRFFEQVLREWDEFVKIYGTEIANVATFWIT